MLRTKEKGSEKEHKEEEEWVSEGKGTRSRRRNACVCAPVREREKEKAVGPSRGAIIIERQGGKREDRNQREIEGKKETGQELSNKQSRDFRTRCAFLLQLP